MVNKVFGTADCTSFTSILVFEGEGNLEMLFTIVYFIVFINDVCTHL